MLGRDVKLCYLWEIHVTVGQMLRLVVVVSRVCNARVILLHGLVLREGRLLCLQLWVHHVAAHQGLGPTRHGLCTKTHRVLQSFTGYHRYSDKTLYMHVLKFHTYPRHCQPQMTKCLPVPQMPCSWL